MSADRSSTGRRASSATRSKAGKKSHKTGSTSRQEGAIVSNAPNKPQLLEAVPPPSRTLDAWVVRNSSTPPAARKSRSPIRSLSPVISVCDDPGEAEKLSTVAGRPPRRRRAGGRARRSDDNGPTARIVEVDGTFPVKRTSEVLERNSEISLSRGGSDDMMLPLPKDTMSTFQKVEDPKDTGGPRGQPRGDTRASNHNGECAAPGEGLRVELLKKDYLDNRSGKAEVDDPDKARRGGNPPSKGAGTPAPRKKTCMKGMNTFTRKDVPSPMTPSSEESSPVSQRATKEVSGAAVDAAAGSAAEPLAAAAESMESVPPQKKRRSGSCRIGEAAPKDPICAPTAGSTRGRPGRPAKKERRRSSAVRGGISAKRASHSSLATAACEGTASGKAGRAPSSRSKSEGNHGNAVQREDAGQFSTGGVAPSSGPAPTRCPGSVEAGQRNMNHGDYETCHTAGEPVATGDSCQLNEEMDGRHRGDELCVADVPVARGEVDTKGDDLHSQESSAELESSQRPKLRVNDASSAYANTSSRSQRAALRARRTSSSSSSDSTAAELRDTESSGASSSGEVENCAVEGIGDNEPGCDSREAVTMSQSRVYEDEQGCAFPPDDSHASSLTADASIKEEEVKSSPRKRMRKAAATAAVNRLASPDGPGDPHATNWVKSGGLTDQCASPLDISSPKRRARAVGGGRERESAEQDVLADAKNGGKRKRTAVSSGSSKQRKLPPPPPAPVLNSRILARIEMIVAAGGHGWGPPPSPPALSPKNGVEEVAEAQRPSGSDVVSDSIPESKPTSAPMALKLEAEVHSSESAARDDLDEAPTELASEQSEATSRDTEPESAADALAPEAVSEPVPKPVPEPVLKSVPEPILEPEAKKADLSVDSARGSEEPGERSSLLPLPTEPWVMSEAELEELTVADGETDFWVFLAGIRQLFETPKYPASLMVLPTLYSLSLPNVKPWDWTRPKIEPIPKSPRLLTPDVPRLVREVSGKD